MFKYFKYTPVSDDYTTHIYRGGKVNYFDGNVVSVAAADAIAQDEIIAAVEITLDEFKTLVAESSQIKRCNEFVAEQIANKYSYADEIAMLKKPLDDADRVVYEAYVVECKTAGKSMKAELGYL